MVRKVPVPIKTGVKCSCSEITFAIVSIIWSLTFKDEQRRLRQVIYLTYEYKLP